MRKLLKTLVFPAILALISCGGGGTPTQNQPQTITVTVSPSTPTIPSGTTQQFTAQVTGTGNTAVTWTASPGTISPAGLYTAPATSANLTATITATAQADPSKSAHATATVTPPPTPTTNSATSPFNGNSPFVVLQNPGATTVQLLGSGFAATDTQVFAPSLPQTPGTFVDSGHWTIGLGFDNNHFRSGFYTIADCNGLACSNPPAGFAFVGDGLSRLGMGTDGRFCQRDAGTVACFNADRSAAGSPFAVGNGAAGIAFDTAKNLVAVAGSSTGPVGLFDITNPGAHFTSANVTGSVKGIAQKDGTGCVAQPNEGIVTIFPVDLTLSTSISSPTGAAGSQPWSVDMAQIGAELDCVSISRDNMLTRFSTVDGSLKGSLSLTGLTSGGVPRVVVFNSGGALGTAAVLSPLDNVIVFVNLNTMAEIRRVPVPPTQTSRAVQIATDEIGANLIIVFGNVSGNVTFSSFAKLAVASGNPIPYSGANSTAALLFMEVAVSPASPNIVGGSMGQNAAVPLQ